MYCKQCGTQLNDGDVLCPNCGEAISDEKSLSENVTQKKKLNVCSVIAIVFASIGIIPILNILFLPVAIILTIVGIFMCKKRGKKAMVASIIVLVMSISISALWMVPVLKGAEFPNFQGSSSQIAATATTSKATNKSCSHSYKKITTEATCIKSGYATYKCSLCNHSYKSYESALGHTTTTGVCSRCGQSFGGWTISYYVDEFKNPTGEPYIKNTDIIYGTFSNSATTNSELAVIILIDTEDVCIKLWEYGSMEVNAYSTTQYKVTYLDGNGKKYYSSGTMYKNGERIYLADWKLVDLLQNHKEVKVYIEENSKYGVNSSYLFTVKQGNFNSVYSDFYNKYID